MEDSPSCQNYPPELWHLEKGGSAQKAKIICRECPVRAACLDFIMKFEFGTCASMRDGIYGGLTPRERRELEVRGWRVGDPLPEIHFRYAA